MFDGPYHDWNQKRIKFIVDFYGHKFFYSKKVLDLGAGYGDIGGVLYRLGADVTAVDARQEHLKIVAKKFPGIKTVQADLDRSWPFTNKQVDVTIHLGLLCHLDNYEEQIKRACSTTTHLILETTVCDSDDPKKCVISSENKGNYDLSINGVSTKPSAAAIEKVLTDCGMNFKRIDSSKLNSGKYVYDWASKNDNGCNYNKRRMWFCVKNNNPIQISPDKNQLADAPNTIDFIRPKAPPPMMLNKSPKPYVPPFEKPVPYQRPLLYGKNKAENIAPLNGAKIRLFFNYYEDKNHNRKAEIDLCLKYNLDNVAFDVIIVDSSDNPTFNFMFEKINRLAGPNDISIICNSDIFFDQTIVLAAKINDKEVYALSRWNWINPTTSKLFDNNCNQDAWIVKGKIENVNGGFQMGKPKCDGRIAFELQAAGYKVSNPSRSIKAFHIHNSKVRNYTENDTIPGECLLLDPVSL
ncbi:MAG TPA: class I SAM-dependent methyltransferase [Candidatus Saccharimonadales bacterium]